jgi:hypothetical protein
MKTITIILTVLGLVALSVPGCLDEKVLQLVFTGETYADFSENETGADNPESAVVDVADEIGDILTENGISLSDIDDAFVTSVHYGVISFDQSHDWTISGSIRVRRNDDGNGSESFATLANYTSSVQGALGEKIPAPLVQAGVDVINTALDDFLNNENPILEFQVQSGTIAPPPSPTDPMVFEWRAWLAIQLITTETVEVPDPF